MANFYSNNNNIDNFLNYDSIYKNNLNNMFYQHICFASIFLFIIIYMIYDYFHCKQKSNLETTKKKKTCTSCKYNNSKNTNTNTQKEENNNLILKYETENFKEVFNKSSLSSS